MAQRQQQLDEKHQLVAELAAQRARITGRYTELSTATRAKVHETTDISSHIRNSFRKHPVAWASAAAAGGFVVTRLLWPPRSRDEKSSSHAKKSALTISALLGMVGKSALKALRPTIEKAVKDRLAAQFGLALSPAPQQPDTP